MAIVQTNTNPPSSVPGLMNAADFELMANDNTEITVNFSASPAQVTILQNSTFSTAHSTSGGISFNSYIADSDTTFSMANTTDYYITYNGSTLSSSGFFPSSTQDCGQYRTSGGAYILNWFIDQTNQRYFKINRNLQRQSFYGYLAADVTPGGVIYPVPWTVDNNTGGFALTASNTEINPSLYSPYMVDINLKYSFTSGGASDALTIAIYNTKAHSSNPIRHITQKTSGTINFSIPLLKNTTTFIVRAFTSFIAYPTGSFTLFGGHDNSNISIRSLL